MAEPMKFEAGMVVKWRDESVARYAIRGVEPDYVRCWRLDNDDRFCGFQISAYGASFELVSPAPRAGDTWTSGESVARVESNGAQLRIVSDGEPFVGDVVAVARKLWDGGYRMAVAAPMHAKSLDEAIEKMKAARDRWTGSAESLAALDGTWPVSVPSAGIGAGIYPTREGIESMFARLNAAEQKYMEAEQAKRAAPGRAAVDVGKGFTVTFPPLPIGTYTLSMNPEAGTAELRGADGVLPGVTVVRQTQDGGRTTAPDDAEGVYSREYHGEFRAPLPRAGDVYEHTDGTIIEVRERERRSGLRTHVLRTAVACPMLVEADAPEILAALLRGYGYTKRDDPRWREDQRRMELEKAEAIVKFAVANRLSTSVAAEAIRRVSREGVPISADSIRECFGFQQARIDATTPQSPLDGMRGDRAERYAKLMKPGVDPKAFVDALDRAKATAAPPSDNIAQMVREQAQKWIDRGALAPQHFDCRVRCADLLDSARRAPDVAPCDRAASRRHVDAAVARLRGEPFARAIEAALVGVSERANLTPAEIAATIAALRHWEARRPFGAALRPEAHAALSRSSAEALRGALGYAPVWDTDLLFSTYERARPHC